MGNGSRLDKEIYTEFSRDWEGLSYQAQMIRADMQGKGIDDIVNFENIEELPAGEDRERMMKTRVGQYFFRTSVLNSYGNRCCITGLARPDLLIASHIKPWKVSDEKTERTNPSNGLCLNPFHDKAFDKGFITIDKNYKVIVSPKIRETEMDLKTREWFMSYENSRISLPDKFLPGNEFIEYHNDMIFQQ